jgi:nucleolar protein 4
MCICFVKEVSLASLVCPSICSHVSGTVVMANSPAAASLPAEELEKRANSFNARRNLLKTNPSLYVSKTRLSIRQIPVGVTEYMLKRLANYAIRKFEEEVGRREREPLGPAETEESEVIEKGRKKGQKVKQAKIIREQNKVDALTGKGKSKGYGFLELHKHEDALRVLRWSNNNRAVGNLWNEWWKSEVGELIKKEKGTGEDGATRMKKLKEEAEREDGRWKAAKKTLIVEFSIENVQVTERRKDRQTPARPSPKPLGETERPEKRQRTGEASSGTVTGEPRRKQRKTNRV